MGLKLHEKEPDRNSSLSHFLIVGRSWRVRLLAPTVTMLGLLVVRLGLGYLALLGLVAKWLLALTSEHRFELLNL